MSQLTKTTTWDGALTDMASVKVGIVRTDTSAVVVATGTAMTRASLGTYTITFTDPAYGLSYLWTLVIVDPDGNTNTYTGTLVGPTAATTTAVTLAEAKAYLRLGSSTTTDALVQVLISGAEDWISEFCGVQFGETTRTDYLDGGGRGLFPYRKPVRHVVSIADRDNTGTVFVLDADYYVRNDRITQASGNASGAWTGRLQEQTARWAEGQGRWIVTYLCGYYLTNPGVDAYTHTAVPGGLKAAILEMVRRMYDNRGGVNSESASGWAVTWLDLHQSDIVTLLSAYMRCDL